MREGYDGRTARYTDSYAFSQNIIARGKVVSMKLPSFLKQTSDNRMNIAISCCLIIAFLVKLYWRTAMYLGLVNPLKTYEYTEFLINYQGGFVRRGLLGEGIYQIYKVYPFPLHLVLTIVCYAVFIYVLVFFLYKFYKRGYSWWLVLSPLF